jgi:hypothetical protein
MLDADGLTAGRPTALAWTLRGGARRLRRLRIELAAYESASVGSSDDSTTIESCFHRQALLDTEDRREMAAGRCEATPPAATVPSFKGPNFKWEWRLEVTGEIPGRPDIDDKYPVRVALPAPEETGQ